MTIAALLGIAAILCGALILFGVGTLATLAGVGLILLGIAVAVGGRTIG